MISKIIKEFDVEVNILQGKISQTQSGSYGTLIIHFDGDETTVEQAIEFIRNQQVELEVIANV
jgi:D-methionine transport system ATP-binding protein